MATALLDPASLLSTPSVAPDPTGFRDYGLPVPRSSGPLLSWNPSHGEVLASLDENFRSSLKFHHATSTERSGFASSEALLTPCWLQVPAPLAQYHGVASQVITSFVSKTESLVCSIIEAHEHTLQLLEALTKIFPSWSNPVSLLSGLAYTVYQMRDTLYKQLGNLRILYRELALRTTCRTDEPVMDVLSKAPILASSTEEQYTADTVAIKGCCFGTGPDTPEHCFYAVHLSISARHQEG